MYAVPLKVFLETVKSLLLHVLQTFGGLPEKHDDSLRRRVDTASDPKPGVSVVPQQINGAQLTTSKRDHERKLAEAREKLIIILTPNIASRMFTILVLGLWGGWSLMPSETKIPDSVAWVTYICIAADW